MVTWEYTTGPVREFMVIASPNYQMVETQVGDITVSSWFLPQDREAGRAALTHAAAALRVFQDWFGPYPFPDLTVVQAPLGVHGMEFPQLSLIGSELYREKRKELEYLVVHEIAHQWWYNQVGNDQIRYPWLDEGLADYSSLHLLLPDVRQGLCRWLLGTRWATIYRYLVSEGKDGPVNLPAFNFGDQYEQMVYGKAALFFRALHEKTGDIAFRQALHQYMDALRYKISTPDRLMAVMNEATGQDLTVLYNQWIRAVGASPTL